MEYLHPIHRMENIDRPQQELNHRLSYLGQYLFLAHLKQAIENNNSVWKKVPSNYYWADVGKWCMHWLCYHYTLREYETNFAIPHIKSLYRFGTKRNFPVKTLPSIAVGEIISTPPSSSSPSINLRFAFTIISPKLTANNAMQITIKALRCSSIAIYFVKLN